jgi:hypothetical protein
MDNVSSPAALAELACLRWTRELARPLKSFRVVVSGLKGGGLWFQLGCWRVSSVREGQFMVGCENEDQDLTRCLNLVFDRVMVGSSEPHENPR